MIKMYKFTFNCLIFLILLVIATNVTKEFLNKQIDYTEAVSIKTYDDIQSYGIFLRDEYIVENNEGNYVHIDVNNASRVKKGQVIGVIYDDRKYLEESIEISNLRDKLNVIDSVATITQTVSQTLKTAVQINNSISEFHQNLDPNDLTSVSYNINEIENISLRGAYSQMSKAELSLEKSYIENEIEQRQLKISSDTSTINADLTGSFVSTIDSYENISEISVDIITEISNKGTYNYADNNNIGKIITSNEWEFACVVNNEDISRITGASRPRLIFENMPSNEIAVTVSKVINENDEQSIVIFKGKATNESILEMRTSNVQIVIRAYEGIKIPKQAVLVIDGKIGIHTLNGSQIEFKEISPIFEKENYYIIPKKSKATSRDIIIGDRIITNSSSLTTKNSTG